MARLFLSYSRKDEARAQRVMQWLEREGHDVWRDDDDIGGGASFSAEIEKALNESDAVVVLWSAESVKSAWVRDEAAFGRDAGKLIPVSLDSTVPPLGFRQFQSIDFSRWKGHGAPPNAERVRRAIGRIGSTSAAGASMTAPRARGRESPIHRLRLKALIAGFLVLVATGALGIFLWQQSAGSEEITIAVLPSPTSPDRATAADFANVAAADMAGFLPTRFAGARVIAPADADSRERGYRIQIAGDRHGQAADASLTLSDEDGKSILWSKSWSVPDTTAVDLREQVSLAASRAALCLTDARGGRTRLEQPALGLYISGCAGLSDPSTSDAELVATFDRVVELSPNFPRAWAMLSVGRAILAEATRERSGRPDIAAINKARQAIATARKLDPHSGLPYLAEWHLSSENPVLGMRLLDKAVQIDPDEPVLQARRSDALLAVGRMADAVDAAHRATELDPLWSYVRSQYILALTYAGQFSRAKAEIAEAHRKWPNNIDIDWADFGFQYRYGDPKIAEQLMPRVLAYSDAELGPYRKVISARLDRSPAKIHDAIDAFRQADQRDHAGRNRQLLTFALFGRVDDAYRLFSDPQSQAHLDSSVLFRPESAGIRADARFMGVAARLGLVRYWRESGYWPDFCTSEQLKYDCKTEAAKYPG